MTECPPVDPETVITSGLGRRIEQRVLLDAAGELQAMMASVPVWAVEAGHIGVRESDLQRSVCRAIQAQLGSVAAVDGPLPPAMKEHWGGWLGRVDVLARPSRTEEIYFETKLCGADRLYEVVWDLLKLSLMTALNEETAGYLVYALPQAAWELNQNDFAAIFETGHVALGDLLYDRYPDPWQWCLDGTRSTRPVNLPAHVRTEHAGSARISVAGGAWELRAVLVQGDSAAGWVSFGPDGWPDGGEGSAQP